MHWGDIMACVGVVISGVGWIIDEKNSFYVQVLLHLTSSNALSIAS